MITNNPMQLKAFTGPFEIFSDPVAGRKNGAAVHALNK